MNIYSFLPLIALFANLFLGFYILYIHPKNRLNQLYSLLTFSLAVWSIANFYMFNALSVSEAFFWNGWGTIGAIFTAIFLFHFSIINCNFKILINKFFFIFLLIIGFLLIFLEFTTNLITEEMNISYWGYSEIPGPLYTFLYAFIVSLVLISLIIHFLILKKSSSSKIKKQSKFVIIAFSIPLLGGVISQVITPYLNIEILPLTSTLTTITAIIIGFTVFKHNLLKPRSFGIQKKIVTMFFILLFCITFFTLFTVNIVSTELINEKNDENLRSIAESRAEHIKTYLLEQKRTTEEISCIGILKDILLMDPKISDYRNGVNQTIDRLMINVNVNDDILEISVINNKGLVIASTNPDIIGINKKNEKLFEKGINGTFIEDIHHYAEGGNKSVFGVSTPVKNEENNSIGLILIKYKIDRLYDIISDLIGLGETGEVYLVNKSGFLISPVRSYNLSYNLENLILKQKIDTKNYNFCMEHAVYDNEEIKYRHDEILICQNYRDEKVLATHIYIKEMQWALLTEIDSQEAMSSLNEMQTKLTIIFSIFAIIVLIISFFYSKTLSAPIKKLDRYSKEITEGNLDVNVDIDSSDEIGSLAKSFKKMTNAIMTHTENLENQVKIRTKELEEKIDELERFKKVTVGRELRMAELKKQIEDLKENNKLGGNQT